MTAMAAEPVTTGGATPPDGAQSPRWIRAQGMLAKELRGRMRGPRAFLVLTFYLLFLAGFTLLIYFLAKLSASTDPTQSIGKPVFLGLVAFQLGLVCFLAPSFTAGVISGERERQTYDLLMTTPLPLALIVATKLFAALAYVFLLIIAALPLLAISLFLGGVAPEEVVIAFLMLFASALLFGTVGLCFSAWVRSTIGAAALAYGAMLLPVVALPIVAATGFSFLAAILSSSNNTSPALSAAVYYIGGFILSLNPFIAGALTEAIIVTNRSLFFFTLQSPFGSGSGTVFAIGPWIIYIVSALIGTVFFYLLALRLARPTRGGGRRRGSAQG
jgi:ABC-type transport system involved in multi-copper enzyme maturation permease subunit